MIKRRVSSRNNSSENEIYLDDKSRIIINFHGVQTDQTINRIANKVSEFAQQLHYQGRRVYILADVRNIKLADVTTSARGRFRYLLTEVPFDRLAIYSKAGPTTMLAMYTIRLSGMSEKTQFFTSYKKALIWLGHHSKSRRSPAISMVAGSLIGIIGVSVLFGWQLDATWLTSWSTRFRPMNPLSAVGLVAVGIGLIGYGMGRLLWLRLAGILGILIGLSAVLSLPIDRVLYGEQVAALGIHGRVADSAAICFLALGIVAIIVGRKWRPRLVVEGVLIIGVGFIAALNLFGQLYAPDWIYSLSPNFVMALNLSVAFLLAAVMLGLLLIYYRTRTNVLARITKTGWMIMSILVFLQFVTYGAWTQANAQNRQQTQVVFRGNANAVQDVLKDRFSTYINALYGFQGLFSSSSQVDQGEFERYYQTTNVAINYPGLRAISFIRKVDTKSLPAYVESVRADRSLFPQGNPNFKIINQSALDQHYILNYVTSNASTANLGNDLGANPSRLQAFQQAEALRRPVASGTVVFAGTSKTPQQNGFFITVPVSTEQSGSQVIGFVNAVFSYETFFSEALGSNINREGMSVNVIDNSDKKTVFASNKMHGKEAAFTYESSVAVADRVWSLKIAAVNDFAGTENALPTAVLVGGQSFSLLLMVIFWIQTRGRVKALNLADDITKDLQRERNTAITNDQKSTAILTSIGDGVFALDTKGRVTVFNKAAQAISGYSEDEVIGKLYQEVLQFEYERNGKVNDAFIKKALSGHLASMSNHTVIVRRDGKKVPVADSAAPIRDSSGKIIGAIIVFRDVSKEYELDKAKTEFVSLASHQLRTPLSAVNWYGEMLLSGDAGRLTKDQREYVQEIFEGSQRMVELVNSLLDVSRLEVGKLANTPEPTDMMSLIESLIKELEVSIMNKKLALEKHVEKIAPVVADPKQLRMVIQNLMSNAVKYTSEKGTIEVTLHLAKASEMQKANLTSTTPHWFFSVADNGFGIPKEEQSKIFGKLFRADNVRKLDVEGTGLGLYIVKEVVEKMGGRVWFESVENKGTVFYVVAPVQIHHARDKHV